MCHYSNFCCFDRRGCIQWTAVQQCSSGVATFSQTFKLNKLANSVKDECSIPEVNFLGRHYKAHTMFSVSEDGSRKD